MTIFDRQSRRDLDQLIEEFSTRNMPRRTFLKRATATGLSLSAASTLLAACGGGPATNGNTKVSSIDVLTEWSGEELASFNAINDAFTAKTKIKVSVESTRDLPAILNTRVKGNSPPDICGMPSLTTFQQLAQQKKLVRLDTFFDMATINKNYNKTWVNLASYNGALYAVLPKANNKGTVWYNPTAFKNAGLTVPATWDDMISLSDKIAGMGKYPWSLGVESGASSGWPAADWIAQIFINLNGPDLYNQWVAHKIPWTDNSIKNAFKMFGQIVNGKHYINGAPQSVLATNFQDATYNPFYPTPKAFMYYLGDFAAGFITGQFKDIKAGTGFSFFPFPSINAQYKNSVTGGADIVVGMKDNDGTRQFLEYLSTAEAQTIWVKRGGSTSVNKAVDINSYPDPVARASAEQMANAANFNLGADDMMPQAVENAFWQATLAYIGDPSKLDSALSTVESTAQQAYTS